MRKSQPNTFRFVDDQTIEIDLTQNQVCLIDASDYDLVKDYHWCYHKSKKCNYGYVVTNYTINGKRTALKMHRLILNFPELHIDHINHDGCDNRRCNLRVCTTSQNCMNQSKRKNNKSGYKGVSFDKTHNKYRSQIMFNKKRIYLGLFVDPVSAAKAYDAKAKELFGEFAVLNFKD